MQRQFDPSYSKDTGRLEKLGFDSNGNGKFDTVAYMDGTQILRAEIDENEDGTVDRREYYADVRDFDAASQSSAGSWPGVVLERVESSTNRDGRMSRWEYYERGILSRVEEDTDGDGKVDKWETYVDGKLATMALDTLGRGVADRRLVYRAGGHLDHVEVDEEGDGSFQPLPKAP